MTAAEALGSFVAALNWSGMPTPLRAKVHDHVLDTLGVMCAGVGNGQGEAATRVLARWGGLAESSLVGSELRLPAPSAAFVNAFHGRILTYDDTYEAGPVHPGAVVVAAALASAEATGASGGEVLAAVLAGYEVAIRVSAALGPSHYAIGFHGTGTCTTFGACAAAARAHGLEAEAIADALGLAGEATAGLRQHQVDGTMANSALNGPRRHVRRHGVGDARGRTHGAPRHPGRPVRHPGDPGA